MKNRTLEIYNGGRKMIGNGRRGVYILSALFLLIFYGISFAQDSDVHKKNWLLGVLSELEKMRDEATLQIKKSDNIISKSNDIINRAKAAGNKKAEQVAMQAILTAQEARKKEEWLKERAAEGIKEINALLDRLSKGNVDAKMIEEAKNLPQKITNGDPSLCSNLEAQLERDKDLIKRYQKTIDMSNKELEKWAKMNEKAADEALEAGIKAVFDGVTTWLEERERVTEAIQKELIKYKVKVAVDGPPKQKILIDRLLGKMSRATDAYVKAKVQADTGKIIRAGLDIKDRYDAFNNILGAIQARLDGADKEVIDILKDPELRANLSDLGNWATNTLISYEEEIRKINPIFGKVASFSSFILEYGYSAKEWWESRKRILQYSDLSDGELKAVNALGQQIKKTMEKLKNCREGIKMDKTERPIISPPQGLRID